MSTIAVKERPILMHARSVTGIRADRKTQTRRLNGLDEINEYPDQWKFDFVHVVNQRLLS